MEFILSCFVLEAWLLWLLQRHQIKRQNGRDELEQTLNGMKIIHMTLFVFVFEPE